MEEWVCKSCLGEFNLSLDDPKVRVIRRRRGQSHAVMVLFEGQAHKLLKKSRWVDKKEKEKEKEKEKANAEQSCEVETSGMGTSEAGEEYPEQSPGDFVPDFYGEGEKR